MICPRCGKKIIKGTFCEECFKIVYPAVAKLKVVKILFCCTCKKARYKNNISRPDIAIENAVANSFILNSDFEIKKIEFLMPEIVLKPGIKKNIFVDTTIYITHPEIEKTYSEKYAVPLYYEVNYCDICKKKESPRYYTAILQVRNETTHSLKYMKELLDELKERVKISKEVPVVSGTDYYMTDTNSAKLIGRRLKQKFGGDIKISAKIFSKDRQTSKDIYRVNILVKLKKEKSN